MYTYVYIYMCVRVCVHVCVCVLNGVMPPFHGYKTDPIMIHKRVTGLSGGVASGFSG